MGAIQQVIASFGAAGESESPFITAITVGTLRNDFSGWLGLKFNTGLNTPSITHVGRWRVAGNSGTHAVRLYRSPDTLIVGANIDMSSGVAGAFKYEAVTPVALLASTDYYLITQEVNTGDQWYSDDPTGIAVDSLAGTLTCSAYNGIADPGLGGFIDAAADKTFGPVNFKFQL